MPNNSLVSIALCTYNGARFLADQLDTLVNQTYSNIEVVVVDDCSTDDTYAILMSYSEKYSNFYVYKNLHNLGFAKNFEKAFGYCNGAYVALCDQDDLWHPDKIKLQVRAIGNNQLIYHDSELIDEFGNPLSDLYKISEDQSQIDHRNKMSEFYNFYKGERSEVFLLKNCISGHTILARKELISKALPFNSEFYHDWWIAYVAVNIGTVDFIPQCLVKYRRHSNSATAQDVLTESQRLAQEIKWLAQCASFGQNKKPKFVRKLYHLYAGYPNAFLSFSLWWVLKSNAEKLFFVSNESEKLKKRYVNKFMWGVKARNFWYTHVRKVPSNLLDV